MGEVNRFSTVLIDLLDLVFVENVRQIINFSSLIIPSEFHGRKHELSLLHVIVNLLIEIL